MGRGFSPTHILERLKELCLRGIWLNLNLDKLELKPRTHLFLFDSALGGRRRE